jgi:glycosyltransferase involved in cell wall biosynthesis
VTNKSDYRTHLLRSVQEWISAGTRIAIFGTGEHTDYLFRCIPELKQTLIAGYLDSDQGRQGMSYRSSTIRPIAWAVDNADLVLCSSFVNERAMAHAAAKLGCKVFLSHPSDVAAFEVFTDEANSWLASKLTFPANSSLDALIASHDQRNFDVIAFSMIDWSYRFQRPQQLAKRIAAAGNRVFYIRNRFSGSRKMSIRNVLPNLLTVELPGPGDFNLYHDSMESFLANSIVENISLLRFQFNIDKAVCLVQFPVWAKPAFELKKRYGWKTVYDCMDYHAGFGNISKSSLKDERSLFINSDLVFLSSHVLRQKILPIKKHCHLLPNAGEFDHFSRSTPKAFKNIERLPRPILGYYGAISQWFDSRLLASISKNRPDWTFLLIGNTHGAHLDSLKQHKNVVFLSEQKYQNLPEFLNLFDVCLIPFKKNRLTDATNPVKLYEYCAAGKPVVASNLEELQWYRKYVYLATSTRCWIDAIEKALLRRSPRDFQSRRNFAQRNNWDDRARVLLREIHKILKRSN